MHDTLASAAEATPELCVTKADIQEVCMPDALEVMKITQVGVWGVDVYGVYGVCVVCVCVGGCVLETTKITQVRVWGVGGGCGGVWGGAYLCVYAGV